MGECPMCVYVSVSVYVHARECFFAHVFVSVQEGKEAKKDEDVEKAEGKAFQSLFRLLLPQSVRKSLITCLGHET